MVKSMTEGLQEHIGSIANAQAASDAKIDRVDTAVSEQNEQLRASEARPQQREASYEQHVAEMRQAMSKLMEGPAAQRGQAPQSSKGASCQAQAQQSRVQGEHVCLLQYDGPRLVGKMKGAEAAWRSRFAPAVTPTEVSAPKHHPVLTVMFETFAEASNYVKMLSGKIFDKNGKRFEAIHKGANANRPPHIIRRGRRLRRCTRPSKAP